MTIALSEDARREIVAEFGLPMDEIVVTSPGVELDVLDASPADHDLVDRDLVPKGRFFLSFATDSPHKNLRNLIDAHALLRQRWSSDGEPPGLILVGSQAPGGNARGGNVLSERPAGVTHLAAVTARQLLALYRTALALVIPSADEGSGLAILEAMAMSTPVIALPLSSVPEVAGEAVLYARGTSPVALAQALEQIATDRSLRNELCRRGPAQAAQFRWERTARLTLAAYRSTVFQPSDRSLRARRLLRDVLASWSNGGQRSTASPELGIRNAWKDSTAPFSVRARQSSVGFVSTTAGGRPEAVSPRPIPEP